MSIEENNQTVPQLYKRRNRCFVSFPYDRKIVNTVQSMHKKWYTPKTREWSFDQASQDEFMSAHPTTVEVNYEMIIYKSKCFVYFKFIDTHNMDELTQLVPEVTYDPDGHVFVIPKSEFSKLEEYVNVKGIKALLRNNEQATTIKRTIKIM